MSCRLIVLENERDGLADDKHTKFSILHGSAYRIMMWLCVSASCVYVYFYNGSPLFDKRAAGAARGTVLTVGVDERLHQPAAAARRRGLRPVVNPQTVLE